MKPYLQEPEPTRLGRLVMANEVRRQANKGWYTKLRYSYPSKARERVKEEAALWKQIQKVEALRRRLKHDSLVG